MTISFNLMVKASGLIKSLQDEPKKMVMNDYVYNHTYLMIVYSMLNTFQIPYSAEYNEDSSIKELTINPEKK